MEFKSQKVTKYGLIVFVILIVSCNNKQLIKLNDIQVIGSHNSYKIAIEKPLWEYLFKKDSIRAKSLQYEHLPIEEQLKLGLRSLELDVYYDPYGGYYSNPEGLKIVESLNENPLKYDEDHLLDRQGLKMFHIQDIDFRSHHLLFRDGLKRIKLWSDRNKEHLPIIVLINAKDKELMGLKKPLKFTTTALNSIDKEILSVFSSEDLITPDFVRGTSKTLEAAILSKGWPLLSETKGKFLFVLDENNEKSNRYINGNLTLEKKIMFVNVKEGNPAAAFRIINDPVENLEYIKRLVSKGYMVRTRADDGTKESRIEDYNKFDHALASGAQVISTDYYLPSNFFKSSYKICFEGNHYQKIKK